MASPAEGEFGQETGSSQERAGFNPYVGPRSFDQEHSSYFFGRDEETRQLTSLVVAHRVVLFYAESGAGKTSLLRASVIPELNRRKKVTILPIGRVGGDLLPGVDGSQVENLFVFNTLVSLVGADAEPAVLQGLSLRQGLEPFLAPRADELRARPTLLILDQLEELFTSHAERYGERAGFFQQLQECLAVYPQLSLLLSMREDYIARLDDYAVQMPDRLRTRFRMERLPVAGALAAVQRPAERAGRPFEPGVAEALVDNLRRIQVATPHEGQAGRPSLGEYVEPVHLQIVCWQLWENLPAGGRAIRAEDVREFGDVDQALTEFYEGTLQKVTDGTGIGQRQLRAWFDEELITPARTRGLVYRAQEETEGLPNHAVDILNNAYLIRVVIRGGEPWYELAHDRLVEPILGSNRAWLEAHLSPLQRQAALWEEQGRQEGALLSGQALAEAEAWALAHSEELAAVEYEFLEQCQQARMRAERERRQARLRLWLAVGATAFAIVAIVLAVVAGLAGQAARNAENTAVAEGQRADRERDAALAAGTAEATAKLGAEASFHEAQTAEAHALAAGTAEATAKLRAEASFRLAQTAEAQALSEAAARAAAEQQAKDSQATVEALLKAMLALQATTTPTPSPTSTPGATGTPTAVPLFSPTPAATPTPNRAATAAAGATVQAVATQFAQVQATQTAMARPSPSLTPTPVARPPLPADAQIVFISTRQGRSDLFAMAATGEGEGAPRPAQYIPINPCDSFFAGCFEAGTPAFQPGTNRFIFHVKVPQPGRARAFDIFLANLTNGQATVTKNLTDSGVPDWDQMEGTWSPDGRQIAFLSTYGDLNRIWLMRDDGFDRRPLTSGKEYKDEQPAWSPDGNWIAVSTEREGGNGAWEITLIDPANGDVRQPVTSLGGVNRAPSWSPAGHRLVFSRGQTTPEDICIVNRDGSGLRCYETRWPEDMPAWSPDGNWIAFHRYVDDTYRTEIFVVRSDFSEEVRLTYQKADDWGPVWMP